MLRISKELGNKEQEGEAYDVLAKSYCKEGNDEERRKYAKELLRISKELGNKEEEVEAGDVLASRIVKKEMIKKAENTPKSCFASARNWGIKSRKPKRNI